MTGVHFARQTLLLGNEVQQTLEGHFLQRLRRGAVDLPADIIPLCVGVDAELD